MKKLIIFGTTDLAELAHFYFKHDSEYEVEAFCLDPEFIREERFKGLPVVPVTELLTRFPSGVYDLFVAVGYKAVNKVRQQKYHYFQEKGYYLPSYLSSKAQSWIDLEGIQNTMIMEGSVIMPYANIGNNVLVWVNSIISHHSTVESHVCITSHCAIGGNVHIRERAFLGLNCTLRQGISIGKGSIIGTAANVLEDVPDNTVYLGNPAKRLEKSPEEFQL